MLPCVELKPEEGKLPETTKKEWNFPNLDLSDTLTANQPVLVIQSPKTPTLSRKLKAVSLDSDPPKQSTSLEVSRDVFSMPNTPKRQLKPKLSCDFDDGGPKSTLTPHFSSNLKRFASNTSISGSQTLKTLPEIMTLQDFSDNRTEPVRIKTKGLLERRGSNASLTIDLGSNTNISETKPPALLRLNTAKSVSNLYLSSMSTDKCFCSSKKTEAQKMTDIQENENKTTVYAETCGNCVIYESVPSKVNNCKNRCQNFHKKCGCLCNIKCRRKSLSNENLYVPPCSFCQTGTSKECNLSNKHCKGYRKACYPRQPDIETSQLLSEDFKLHLQNNQYLQTAGNVLSVSDLKLACETQRIPKLHQEFWAVPLNLQEKCLVSGSQSRNRYRGVLPNEHSRVLLQGSQTYIHANYIKGPDYTETAYIATQGPMAHTCEDFWEMTWLAKSHCIVMLTGLVEKGRSKCELYFPLSRSKLNSDLPQEKSYYCVKTNKIQDRFTFDSKNTQQFEEIVVKFEELDEVQHGKYKIKHLMQEMIGDCAIRKLLLTNTDKNESRIVHHYWYSNWQDHKMANPEQVLKIAQHVLNLLERNNHDNNLKGEDRPHLVNGEGAVAQKHAEKRPKPTEMFRFDGYEKKSKISTETDVEAQEVILEGGRYQPVPPKAPRSAKPTRDDKVPLIVHCSAGIGRTGCFLAILNGMQQLRSNFNVDVLAILCSLRLNRGGLVQTAEQYELVHRVLSLYSDSL